MKLFFNFKDHHAQFLFLDYYHYLKSLQLHANALFLFLILGFFKSNSGSILVILDFYYHYLKSLQIHANVLFLFLILKFFTSDSVSILVILGFQSNLYLSRMKTIILIFMDIFLILYFLIYPSQSQKLFITNLINGFLILLVIIYSNFQIYRLIAQNSKYSIIPFFQIYRLMVQNCKYYIIPFLYSSPLINFNSNYFRIFSFFNLGILKMNYQKHFVCHVKKIKFLSLYHFIQIFN